MQPTLFQIHPLPRATFQHLFSANNDQLHAQHAERVVADSPTAFPCRVSMQDASAGETLLLLEYQYHAVEAPYRASGPIFIRENASVANFAPGEVPELLRKRFLSVRGYDKAGYMRDAAVTEGHELPAAIERLFANDRIAYLHLHNAMTGCYLAAANRAG